MKTTKALESEVGDDWLAVSSRIHSAAAVMMKAWPDVIEIDEGGDMNLGILRSWVANDGMKVTILLEVGGGVDVLETVGGQRVAVEKLMTRSGLSVVGFCSIQWEEEREGEGGRGCRVGEMVERWRVAAY